MSDTATSRHNLTNAIVHAFLHSNLSAILILLATALGVAALLLTPREEDPQIVVPLADVYVSAPGFSAAEMEQLVTTPLEKMLYQIDGVEYVYSMSRPSQALITVRYYVGEDRERSLVKLYKKIQENLDALPPGVRQWLVKPVEIDDVPIVTLTLTSATADSFVLRRVAEEMVERLATIENISRAYVVGGQPRRVRVELDPGRLRAHNLSLLEVREAIGSANVTHPVGAFARADAITTVEAGLALAHSAQLREVVVGVFAERPVFLKDVATLLDGPAEAADYVRHGWGMARGLETHFGTSGTVLGEHHPPASETTPTVEEPRPHTDTMAGPPNLPEPTPGVTIALAKKKGTNAVWLSQAILRQAELLRRQIVPDDIEVVITRNYGLITDEKVNELIEALTVAVFLVILVLTLGLGWREALIVAVAVPVVFGLTLAANMAMGFTINRVTLFALILALGLLVDDPIVDVENITRHFSLRGQATRQIVLEAVSEIRPPLITATLAVIVSFLPMFFITGMMGPYMRPMAFNVPLTMLMSMIVAFTITPWLSYHLMKKKYTVALAQAANAGEAQAGKSHSLEVNKATGLYRFFRLLLGPMLRYPTLGWAFLLLIAGLTLAAASLAALRLVPLKMLPFDNKGELLLVLDFPEGTTLERSDAAVRELESYLQTVPEVTDFTSYVGVASPVDFNGLVRHYYLRQGPNLAELRLNLAPKKRRQCQSHAIGLRLRDDLQRIANDHRAALKIVEIPPGPPVISTITVEVYGQPHHRYEDLVVASRRVRARLTQEPGVVDVDDTVEAPSSKLVFITDQEKAALAGVSVETIAQTLSVALSGEVVGLIHQEGERHPLSIELRLPRHLRSSAHELAQIHVKGRELVSLAELGRWEERTLETTIYHKNLQRLVYVFAETAGRTPAEVILDLLADRVPSPEPTAAKAMVTSADDCTVASPRPVETRTFLRSGGGLPWSVPPEIRLNFAGEGEWQITLDVFRDLGLAFGAALVGIYILLVAQTRSFVIPVVVMLSIPLTILGIMPGFWLLNLLGSRPIGPYADPILFTATAMIGMIALAGIVTRQAIILVDFIHLQLRQGKDLPSAILDSCVVRLRPILLTSSTALLSSIPITMDPIFSGLAWALIFGLFASTLFTLLVIPLIYYLVYRKTPGHGISDP